MIGYKAMKGYPALELPVTSRDGTSTVEMERLIEASASKA